MLDVQTYIVTQNLNIQQREHTDVTHYGNEWWILLESNNVKLEPQYMSSWCWVACARMASTKYMESYVSQASAAVYVMLNIEKNSPYPEEIEAANGDGTNGQTEMALEFILKSDNVYSTYFKIYSEAALRAMLDAGSPVIVSRGWYDSNNERNGGHSTIIYSYYWDSTYNVYMYNIYDPSPVNTGSSYSRSYQSLCNGRKGDISDRGIWEGVVVYKIGNYTNTIDSLAPLIF